MAGSTEEEFRKATEDLVHANVREIFQVKYGEKTLVVGENFITFPGTAYSAAGSYEIKILEALDKNDIDITEALEIKNVLTTGFTVNSPRTGSLRWTTNLKTPQFNFWD